MKFTSGTLKRSTWNADSTHDSHTQHLSVSAFDWSVSHFFICGQPDTSPVASLKMYLEPILYGLRYVFLPMRRGLTPFMGRSRWWSVIIWGASLSRLTCRKPRLSTFPELPRKWKPKRELLVMSPCPMAIVSVGPILLKLRSKWTSDWFSLMASPRFFPTVPGYRCPWPSPFQQRSITLSFGFCLNIWATLAAPGPEILFQPRYNSAMFEIPSHLSNSHAICLIPESVI